MPFHRAEEGGHYFHYDLVLASENSGVNAEEVLTALMPISKFEDHSRYNRAGDGFSSAPGFWQAGYRMYLQEN